MVKVSYPGAAECGELQGVPLGPMSPRLASARRLGQALMSNSSKLRAAGGAKVFRKWRH